MDRGQLGHRSVSGQPCEHTGSYIGLSCQCVLISAVLRDFMRTCRPFQPLNKQVIFFQNAISFSNIVHNRCNVSAWN